MTNLTELNKRIAPYTASAHLTEMTDLHFFGFVVTVTAPDGRKMASATDGERMIEPIVLSLIDVLEAQMNTKEFEENLKKANDVVLFSKEGFTVAHYTGNQVLHNIYRMAGEIHEKLVVRDTPMLVVDKDGKEHCPVCGRKVKKAFCPKCGQRLIYQEVEE